LLCVRPIHHTMVRNGTCKKCDIYGFDQGS